MERIRPSLHHGTYIEHAQCLKLAADENVRLFDKYAPIFNIEEDRKRSLGLYSSSMLLCALCLENIFKARALYCEKENIENGNIKTFNDFLKKWNKKSNGHEFNKIIEFYNIDITNEENKIIAELQSYTIWNGRFLYPRDEELIKVFESGEGNWGELSLNYIDLIGKLINRQINEMREKNAL